MMIVDTEKCTGCKACVLDCFPNDIEMVNGKAAMKNSACIACGHCIAICPAGAVYSDAHDMSEVKNYNQENFSIDAGKLLNFIKFRRSIRRFKSQAVAPDLLKTVIEAGRFTPTGSNLQDVSYIVVQDGLPELKTLVLKTLKTMGESYLAGDAAALSAALSPALQADLLKRYAEKWIGMYETYQQDPAQDRLFFNAPAIIVVTAGSAMSGGLASASMELMANALGLGVLFSGYFVRAARVNPEITAFLGVKPGREIISCLVIGYPAVRYLRTVPRNPADINWK